MTPISISEELLAHRALVKLKGADPVIACATAAIWTDPSRHRELPRGTPRFTTDVVAFGYRFATWCIEHAWKNDTTVNHWGLTVDPSAPGAFEIANKEALLRALWQKTGAVCVARAESHHAHERTYEHFRWHDDGGVPVPSSLREKTLENVAWTTISVR